MGDEAREFRRSVTRMTTQGKLDDRNARKHPDSGYTETELADGLVVATTPRVVAYIVKKYGVDEYNAAKIVGRNLDLLNDGMANESLACDVAEDLMAVEEGRDTGTSGTQGDGVGGPGGP